MHESLALRSQTHLTTIIAGILLFTTGICLKAEPAAVSRTPPKLYEEQLKPLLSSWESIEERVKKAWPAGPEDIAEDWAREEIIWVSDDAKKLTTVRHDVAKALKAEGVRLLAQPEMTFSARDERVHLVQARSTRDGKVFKEVADEGVFIKRRESREDEGVMHTDQEVLTVVLPDVSEGSIVETILMREDNAPGVPGHVMRQAMWAGIGAMHLRRLVVILPAALEKELRWKAVGIVLKEPARQELPNGRVRLEWASEGLPPPLMEERGPHFTQAGPLLRLSTLPDWEAVGRWYADEVREAGDVSAEQMEEAAKIVTGAKDPKEKAARLYEHVTNGVRYTALEFGRGRYQPRKPALVAETRYGDCKDKANLLRVLLQKHGIESRLALLDTRHAGIIDASIPSPGRFNHAILAVTLPGEKTPVFCDPTNEGAPFGILGPNDIDREALVIDINGGIEWLRTPRQDFMRLRVEVDLTAEPGGGVSGWAHVSVDAVYGHYLKHRWNKQNTEGRMRIVRGTVDGPQGQEVIDFTDEVAAAKKTQAAAFQISAYVLKPGAAITTGQTSERISFPSIGLLLPTTGRQAQRQTAVATSPVEIKINGGYTLPKGWQVLDLPTSFKRETAGCTLQAEWKQQGTRLLCECTIATTQTLITPAEHPALWQARRDFAEWLSQPALLKRPALPNPDPEAEKDEPYVWRPDPAKLPKMPRATGQVLLLNKRFPVDPQNIFEADYVARGTAAKKLLKDFPKDPVAKFEGEMQLILSDVMDDFDFEGLEKRIEPLLVDADGELTVEQIARGRVMLAGMLAENGKMPEALALAQANYDNERVPLLLRQFSAGVAALALEKAEPARAVEMGRVALAAKGIPSITLDPIFNAVISSLARLPGTTPAALREEMQQVFLAHPTEAEDLRETLMSLPEDLVPQGHLEAAEKLVEGMDLSIQAGGWDEGAKEGLESVRRLMAGARAGAPAYQQLVSYLKQHPWPDADKLEKDRKIEDAEYSREAAEDHRDEPDIRMRYLLRGMTHYGPQPYLAELLEEAAEWANDWFAMKQGPKPPPQTEALLDELVRLWAASPPESVAAWDAEIFRGRVIERREGKDKAVAHYERLSEQAGKDGDRRIRAHMRLAGIHERSKDYPRVLAEWQKTQQWPDADRPALDAALNAAHLAVMLKDYAAAWNSFEWLVHRPEELSSADFPPREELKKLMANKSAGEAWWNKTAQWSAEWEALAQKKDLAPNREHTLADKPEVDAARVARWADKISADKNLLCSYLHSVIHGARVYPHMAEAAAKLLRNQAAKTFPQHRSNFQKLAAKIAP